MILLMMAVSSLMIGVRSNVIGFDFGSTYFKITLVKPGQPFAIVENVASKRKTDSMLVITEEQRILGDDAFMEQTKYPKNTFGRLQKYLGMEYDEDIINLLKKERFIINEMEKDDRGLIGWKITRKFNNGTKLEEILYTEELLAMLLKFGR